MHACLPWLSSTLLASLMACSASAGEVLDRIHRSGELRVCVWPDYYGISYRNPKTRQFTGLDIDLSAEFARELGARLHHVDSSFTSLVDDLLKDRCDIAMFAVGVLPQREKVLRFSLPYLQSDIYAVATRSSRAVRRWEDIDQPGVVVLDPSDRVVTLRGVVKPAHLARRHASVDVVLQVGGDAIGVRGPMRSAG